MTDKNEIWGVFCGPIEPGTVQRIFQGMTAATQTNVTGIHLLFQSAGGFISDGICIYNFFRALPIELTLYNPGGVMSIGSVAFLGTDKRKTSAYASFMLHRSFIANPIATAAGLKSSAQTLAIDDQRTEAILRKHITLSEERWSELAYHELYFSGAEAVEIGLATEIAEFTPPKGERLFFV